MQKRIAIILALIISLLLTTKTTSAQTQSAPSLKTITPQENQTIYGDKVPVLLDVQNFTIVDFQTNKTLVYQQGHIHLWLDDQNPTPESATKVTSDEFTFSDVPYGEHTLKAELVNNNHTSLTPPKTITIKFRNDPIASPSPVSGNAFDKNTALVILIVVALVIVAAWWYTKEEDEEIEEEKSETKKTAKKKAPPAGGKKAASKTRRRK